MKSDPPRNRPRSLADLFFSFTALALQGFGGVLAVVQHELVERKAWMTREEFLEDWAVAQVLPGPNVINLSLMIGNRYFGLPGAMAALAGMLVAPLAVVLLLATLALRFAEHPAMAGALRGMAAVAAGLILAAGIRLAATFRSHVLPFAVCLVLASACFAAVALWRIPLAWVLLGPGAAGYLLAYRRLACRKS